MAVTTEKESEAEVQPMGESPQYFLGDPESQQQLDFTVVSVRQGFIRKVYSILMVQLLITSGFIAGFLFDRDLRLWVRRNALFVLGACILSFCLTLAMVCCDRARRKFPLNFILLFLFTVIESFLVGAVSSFYQAESVLLAAGITVVICFSLTVFAFQTKIDFTGWGPYLFVSTIVLFLFGIAAALLSSILPVMHTLYACLGALLFSVYLIYDTQLIIGGKHKNSISPEEYTFAALTLYIDIINIFLKILVATGKKRD
ncbi:unnamed protein product [Allacma fusca]|uniref:Uncharacterized protein n=1 Tax=Allacma fusca TaxID=39272 RepID=A0A8J2J6Y0_9HEXA|nr:unnamed protein product [Allacma fusca]